MSHWLLKSEPKSYSWDDLVRDKETRWDGVSNAVALKHLRAMKKGDKVLIYHTGLERAAVGIAEVTSAPYPDPKADDDRLVVVDLRPRKKLARPITLAEIRADKAFANWDLLRIGRLSVVPVPEALWHRLLEMSEPRGDTRKLP